MVCSVARKFSSFLLKKAENNPNKKLTEKLRLKLLKMKSFCSMVIHHQKMNTGISQYRLDDMFDEFEEIKFYFEKLREANLIDTKDLQIKGISNDEKEEIRKFLVGEAPLEEILEDIEYSKEYSKKYEKKYVYKEDDKEEKEDEKEKKNNSKKDK